MNGERTETSSQLRFDRMAVGDVMTTDPVTVDVDATVEAALQLLAAYRISGLPVVDAAGHLVGVVSRTDLFPEGGVALSQLVRGRASGLRVGEIMSRPPLTVGLSGTLAEAARIMGVSLSGMKSRVQRGRERLKVILLDCCRIELDCRNAIVAYQKRDAEPCCTKPKKG